jgi:sarcosine oxidase
MQTLDVAIVGAGVMGAAAAHELALEGARVAVFDQAGLPNPRAASVDHSKVFRFAYPDALYVKLAVDALRRWRSLESQSGARLLTQTGALLLGKREASFETDCHQVLRSLGLESEKLDSRQSAARFPQFNSDAFALGVYDPSGGILHAETAVRVLIDLARKRGVVFNEGTRIVEVKQQPGAPNVSIITEHGQQIECGRAMVASGPWSRKLLQLLEDKLTTTRQEIVYFEPSQDARSGESFEPERFPIFLELDSGFYGFPTHFSGAMKIANHHKGAIVDPDSTEQTVGDAFIRSCRTFFSEFIPALAGATVRETRVCIYNNTPDDDFIIDWHPQLDRVLVVTGFSGHGFKFGPTIGRIAAEVLLSCGTTFNIDRFRLARLNNRER